MSCALRATSFQQYHIEYVILYMIRFTSDGAIFLCCYYLLKIIVSPFFIRSAYLRRATVLSVCVFLFYTRYSFQRSLH